MLNIPYRRQPVIGQGLQTEEVCSACGFWHSSLVPRLRWPSSYLCMVHTSTCKCNHMVKEISILSHSIIWVKKKKISNKFCYRVLRIPKGFSIVLSETITVNVVIFAVQLISVNFAQNSASVNSKTRKNICDIVCAHLGHVGVVYWPCVLMQMGNILENVWGLLCFYAAQLLVNVSWSWC